MNSPEKRRDMKKLQNKRKRQKWHFLGDFCVAFVGRKMKCEDQGEVEGGRGHVENGMSKNKKRRRKCVRGKTNLWEMRQESVRLACCLMDRAVAVRVEGDRLFAGWRTGKKKKWYGFLWAGVSKKGNSAEMGDENKSQNIISLWRRISLAGRLCRQRVWERMLENKDGEANGRQAWGDVTEARKPDRDDGDKSRFQTAVFVAAV